MGGRLFVANAEFKRQKPQRHQSEYVSVGENLHTKALQPSLTFVWCFRTPEIEQK
jgi:hypothetical protein